MPFRRSNSPSPFEVMSGSTSNGRIKPGPTAQTVGPPPDEPPTEPVQRPLGESGSGPTAWLARAAAPTLLGQPVGLLILGAVVVAGLIVLAFWLGRDRTPSPSPKAPAAGSVATLGAAQNVPIAPEPVPGTVDPAVAAQRAAAALAAKAVVKPGAGNDPRQTGNRYFVLAAYGTRPEHVDYVKRLLAFLWSKGVDAAAVRGHNGRFYKVVALYGFPPRSGDNIDAYKQLLLKLGREWDTLHRGANDLSDMYLETYQGEPAETIILKENPS